MSPLRRKTSLWESPLARRKAFSLAPMSFMFLLLGGVRPSGHRAHHVLLSNWLGRLPVADCFPRPAPPCCARFRPHAVIVPPAGPIAIASTGHILAVREFSTGNWVRLYALS